MLPSLSARVFQATTKTEEERERKKMIVSKKDEFINSFIKGKYLFYVYHQHIELTEKGHQPLILSWYYVTKSNKDTEEEKDSIYLY